MDAEPVVELFLKHPSKFLELLAIEVSLLSSTVLLTDSCFCRGLAILDIVRWFSTWQFMQPELEPEFQWVHIPGIFEVECSAFYFCSSQNPIFAKIRLFHYPALPKHTQVPPVHLTASLAFSVAMAQLKLAEPAKLSQEQAAQAN